MEALGTFALCYVGGWAGVGSSPTDPAALTGIALAHGLVLGLFVFLGASISGGHFNPAVSIALWATGHHRLDDAVRYVLAQFGGSIVAGVFLYGMRPWPQKELKMGEKGLSLGHPALAPGVDGLTGFVCEALATGTLVLCVMAAGVHRKASEAAVSFMVGCSLLIGVLSIGPVTGAALNPARVFGPAMVAGTVAEKGHLIYYFGPIFGGVIVALLYQSVFIKGLSYKKTEVDDKGELPYLDN